MGWKLGDKGRGLGRYNIKLKLDIFRSYLNFFCLISVFLYVEDLILFGLFLVTLSGAGVVTWATSFDASLCSADNPARGDAPLLTVKCSNGLCSELTGSTTLTPPLSLFTGDFSFPWSLIGVELVGVNTAPWSATGLRWTTGGGSGWTGLATSK